MSVAPKSTSIASRGASHSASREVRVDEGSTPFRHGVASGDPTGEAVVIWTRVTSDAAAVPVAWWLEPADGGPGERREGTAEAGPDHDWTVAVDVGGLAPGRRYRYGFSALGSDSVVGR